jgi:hypothetical protein
VVKHILHYLCSTHLLAICYNHQYYDKQDPSTLLPYITVDANFRPSNQDNQKSLSAIEVIMCSGVVAWTIKTQPCIALSTTKAKLYTISTSVCQALYMQKLFPSLSLPINLPVQLYNNNQSAITIIHSKGGNFHGAKKHYNMHIKHAHNALTNGQIILTYCPSKQLPANILMKALGQVQFNKLKTRLNLMTVRIEGSVRSTNQHTHTCSVFILSILSISQVGLQNLARKLSDLVAHQL